MSINLTVPNNTETPDLKPRITVVGVGGAGGNAVNNMIQRELGGVDFVVTNTDAQALSQSNAERRIQLGAHLTQGLGAGAKPEIGRAAAEEAVDDLLSELEGSHMAFVAAGMGGGTGTGAAPVIARAAREAGILTVGVVTKPFQFEGSHRMKIAEKGIEELAQYVDTLIIIPNQNLFRIANESTTFSDAFAMADQVLYSGVRGVTDLIVMPGLINLDFADIRSVMSQMGKAMMGTGEAEGERRALDAAEAAIANPLLEDTSMKGAKGVLINITGSNDITLFEVDEAATRIRSEVDDDAHIIVGSAFDPSLEGVMRVSVVATGIDADAARMPAPITLSISEERHQPAMMEAIPAEAEKVEVAAAVSEDISIPEEVTEPGVEVSEEKKMSSALERLFEQTEETEENVPVSSPVEMKENPEDTTAGQDQDTAEPQSASESMVTPDPEKQEKPAEPAMAAPALGATDAFIPPKPATSQIRADETKPDPFRVADMANGGGEAKPDENKSGESRRMSLFERVTRTGKAAIDRVSGTETSQVTDIADKIKPSEPRMSAPSASGSGMAPPPAQKVANGQAEMAGMMPSAAVQEQDDAEQDDLDIPAFLRRQAN